MSPDLNERHHVVVVGGGFAGLQTARGLGRAPVRVTLVDRRNFHLFQPLLYQVATGGLPAADIAAPLRGVLRRQRNVRVLLDEMVDFVPEDRRLILAEGELQYDMLVLATGVRPNYFGHPDWAEHALGLKTVEDAIRIRSRVLFAFEHAERTADAAERREWLTFVVVGAGSAGVELAGAVSELARHAMRNQFHAISPGEARVLLIEGADRVLPTYPPRLSAAAHESLASLGADVLTRTLVTDVSADTVTLETGRGVERVHARTVLWTAGIMASPAASVLESRLEVERDRLGRIIVANDLTIPQHPDIYVVGDLASATSGAGEPLPATAPVAMQEGRYVARSIRERLQGRTPRPFHYRDRGNLAVIGRNAAVAEIRKAHFSGFLAWALWVTVHIFYLIGFENRLLVMVRWIWDYLARRGGARLILGDRD